MEEMANQSQETTTQEVNTETQAAQSTENTTQQTEQATTTETPKPSIKVKFNHEEREIPYEEATTLVQKGMAYEKSVERAAQQARDALIAEQNYEWNGKPIRTEAEYKQALREKEIYDSLANKDLPPEVLEELVESRKFREQSKAEREAQKAEAQKQAHYTEFIEAYPDVKPGDIPQGVWDSFSQGKSLIDAYRGHENQILKDKIANLEKALNIQNTNAANAATSPGSLTGLGAPVQDYISPETFEQNKHDQRWVIKNLSKIQESRAKW